MGNDMMTAGDALQALQSLANPEIAEHSARYFKTGLGGYGEGDRFLGIRVPIIRKQASIFKHLDLDELAILLRSSWHEARLCALIIMVRRFEKVGDSDKEAVFNFYMDHLVFVNNWDLVDTSAPKIVGAYLWDKPRTLLFELADSDNLWQRRIAVLSTFYFIDRNDFEDALSIAERLLSDSHDLIHKAVGWLLREIGKRDIETETGFLNRHCKSMPRTMLRYAVERFEQTQRQAYLKGRCNK